MRNNIIRQRERLVSKVVRNVPVTLLPPQIYPLSIPIPKTQAQSNNPSPRVIETDDHLVNLIVRNSSETLENRNLVNGHDAKI